MRKVFYKSGRISLIILFAVSFALTSMLYAEGDKSGEGDKLSKTQTATQVAQSGKVGDGFVMNVNNITLPMNSRGVIADVQVGGQAAGGFYDNNIFLFSAGVWMGGVYENDAGNEKVWTLGNASASRAVHFLPGTWETGSQDDRAQIYVVRKSDPAFGQSWQDWKDAVALGAKFYDGDGDGEYNPVDKNGNGEWDENEDRPDLIGDVTAWTAYHDGVSPPNKSGFENVPQMGINIRQSIFGFASKGNLGNILFVRFEIENTGKVASVLDSVYFGTWADPDLGDYENDVVGSDVDLNAGYVYDNEPDNVYDNSPTFMIDFFQGPVSYIPGETFVDANGNGVFDEGETALDTAHLVHGKYRGVKAVPGARLEGMSSFVHYIQSHATRGDPDNEQQAYNYLNGTNAFGDVLDPCDDNSTPFSVYKPGAGCDKISPYYWFSGDPVADTGWICTENVDQRQMSNTGPFKLREGEPIEIVAAYVVGRASTSLQSVEATREIDRFAQFIYDQNFATAESPPAVEPTVKTTENTIELIWDTAEYLNWSSTAVDDDGFTIYDVKFEGFEVNMYNSNSTANLEGGQENKKTIARYDVENSIGDVITENPSTGERTVAYPSGTQLDPDVYGDPETGRIKLVIDQDPFTGGPLVKDKPYYISVSAYGLNHTVKQDLGDNKTLIPGSAFIGVKASLPRILGDDPGIKTGKHLLEPFRSGVEMEKTAGASVAKASYDVVNREASKTHQYEVSFEYDSTATDYYNVFWKVTDTDANTVILDSADVYEQTKPLYVADGVMPIIEWIDPGIDTVYYDGGASDYFTPLSADTLTGAHYMGKDLEVDRYPYAIKNFGQRSLSDYTRAFTMKRVEIRFDEPSKAYRFVRPGILNLDRFIYPFEGIDAGSGFVDVPFSAYIKDFRTGEEEKLAVAYLETYPSGGDGLGYPDEVWNPYTDLQKSREYIVVFNTPYNPNGDNPIYTNVGQQAKSLTQGYTLDTSDPEITDSMATIAASPWYNALYTIGLQAIDSTDNFQPSGKVVIEPNYILTEDDKYQYRTLTELSQKEKEDLFDKVNVYPNPLMGHNPRTSHTDNNPDEPFVTFTNLPEEAEIRIFTISGSHVRTLKKNNSSPTMQWDLNNEEGLRVASGMYLAIVESPGLGEKVLKLGIVMPQKQIQRY